jgi:hypothetical protein
LTIADADTAARICGHLMRKLKRIQSQCLSQSVYENYQVALRRERGKPSSCQLSIRVDPSECYKSERNRTQASAYVERVKLLCQRDPFFIDKKPPKGNYQNLEDLFSCEKQIQFCGSLRRCKFFVKKLNCIYETDKFYAAIRADGLPIITICPKEHCTNENWLQTSECWNAAFEVLLYLKNELGLSDVPFSEIYASFGRWNTQIKGGYSEGHAHINIVLTPTVIAACKK